MKKIHILRTDKSWKPLQIGASQGAKVFCVLCDFSITFIVLLVISCIVISVIKEGEQNKTKQKIKTKKGANC